MGCLGSNIHVEKCFVPAGPAGGFVIQGNSSGQTANQPMTNVIFRLNTVANQYINTTGLIHGSYFFHCNGLLAEGNVWHHNGWGPSMTRATPLANGGPTVRKHNVYANRPGNDVHFRYNISSQASSHGLHGKVGGKFYYNLLLNNPIHLQMGYGKDNDFEEYGFVTGAHFHHNMCLGAQEINTDQGDLRGQVIRFACVVSSVFENNYGVDNLTVKSGDYSDSFMVAEHEYQLGITYRNNVARNWSPWWLFHGQGTAPYTLTDGGGNIQSASSISGAAQSLVNTLVADSWINAVVAAKDGADINLIRSYMSTIRNGITA